ncbi:MAG TPA: hypothetical protein VF498_08040, partial [Anaerolineales bacterium]
MPETFFSRFVGRMFGGEISRRVGLAVAALDDARDRMYTRDTYPRDRHDYDRDEVLQDALEAWRVNPVARRIVELTTQYVVGGGISLESRHKRSNDFLQEWWKHRLNRLDSRLAELCDELSRSGELFVVLSTDPAGMTYVRALPAADVLWIETAANDIEQELAVWEKPRGDGLDELGPEGLTGRRWAVYDPEKDDGRGPAVLHYAVNRPVGAKHGESDLAPLLRWLSRYANWLEDRARLNRFRQSFMYVVTAKFASKAEKLARQAELNANPPNPGSILVTDETETWAVLNPQLDSHEAGEDGLSLKKMVAAGAGVPLHFLAEPESATRTTAEASGGPTFRRYQQRQVYFLWMVEDLARAALKRRRRVDRLIKPDAELSVKGSDISSRDGTRLAGAASAVIAAFGTLRDRGLIDDAELLRLSYQFAGVVVDVEQMLEKGKAAGDPSPGPFPEGKGRKTDSAKDGDSTIDDGADHSAKDGSARDG